MNCCSEVLELSVEARQVEEAMLAVLHTILLHRSTAKFRYHPDGTYSIGTLGTRDVDCHSVEDFTFVRASCDRLHAILFKAVSDFKSDWSGDGTGQLSLEFYQKRKGRWLFADECVPWEVWSVKVKLVDSPPPNGRQPRQSGWANEKHQRQEAGEQLAEKLINVVQVMNRHRYLPATPAQAQIDQVFDTSLTEVQPYLYRITQHHMTESLGASVGTAVRKLIRDTLAL